MRTHAIVRSALAAAVLLAVLPLASCAPAGAPSGGGSGRTPVETGAVAIENFSFSPANIEVKVGTTVTWTNKDSTQHTVTSDSGTFSSDTIESGQTYRFTFPAAGTFKYHCSIHPSMVAQVVVK